jgi:hypothetical protein
MKKIDKDITLHHPPKIYTVRQKDPLMIGGLFVSILLMVRLDKVSDFS